MAESIDEIIAELDAFEPSDDAIDNDEKLQIWVDRWAQTEDKEQGVAGMLRLFERYPEANNLGEPGPLVHAIEQVPGYEQALATSLEQAPSYYGVWMVNRMLEGKLPPDVRSAWLDVLKRVAESEAAPPSVATTAREFLGFQEA